MLHVHTGDSSADTLRRSGVPGEVVAWVELLHEGPVPAGEAGDAWRRRRADFLSGVTGGARSPAQCLRLLEEQDRALERATAHEETVIWCDACLYDQTILLCLLDRFAALRPGPARLSLVDVGEFPGMPRFKGLGELDAGQLASLLPARRPAGSRVLDLARAAWDAYRSPDPTAVERVLAGDTAALPHLAAALRRWLEEFPWTTDGLGRLDRAILEAAAEGSGYPGDVFQRASAAEPRPFFGDTTLWRHINELAGLPTPLLRLDGPGLLPLWEPPADLSAWRVTLTDAGRAVLRGERSRLDCGPWERWLGGVRVAPGNLWLWDAPDGRLCRA